MKIKMMNSQIFTGGKKIEETEQFKTAIENQQSEFEKELKRKMLELEKEKETIMDDKMQLDQAKTLISKQTFILNSLTTKITDRDETIRLLQEELESTENTASELEDLLVKSEKKLEESADLLRANGVKFDEDGMDEMLKNQNMSQMAKRYLPHHIEYNTEEDENMPYMLMTAEEKINELRFIVKEQKEELEILKNLGVLSNEKNLNSISAQFTKMTEEKEELEKMLQRKNNEVLTLKNYIEENAENNDKFNTSVTSKSDGRLKESIKGKLNEFLTMLATQNLNQETVVDEMQELMFEIEEMFDHTESKLPFNSAKKVDMSTKSKSYRNITYANQGTELKSTIKQNLMNNRSSLGSNTPKAAKTISGQRNSNPFPNYFSSSKVEDGKSTKSRIKQEKK